MRSIIIKGDDSRVHALPVQDLLGKTKAPNASSGTESPCETQVELMRVGGEVHGLEVRCSCGEVTVIQLRYSEAQPPSVPADAEPAKPGQ